MKKKIEPIKFSKKEILFLLIGVLFTVGSFLIFYLPDKKIWFLIIIFSIIDVVLGVCNLFIILDTPFSGIKKFAVTIIYLICYSIIFCAIPLIFLLVTGDGGTILKIWSDVIFCSLFTAPSVVVVIFLVVFIISYY